MTFGLAFKFTDVAIVVATLLGPILAVQAQKWLERDRVVRDRRLQVFRTLMTTRAMNLSPAHVEALNAVPVEFYGPTKPKLKSITDDCTPISIILIQRANRQKFGGPKGLNYW
jgi:hypothetical protein